MSEDLLTLIALVLAFMNFSVALILRNWHSALGWFTAFIAFLK